MGKYNPKGSYAGYDKNNKEREAFDYYATPPKEVTNILNKIGLDLKDQLILDPGCGGGHLIDGILEYEDEAEIIGTDIMKRENKFGAHHNPISYYYGKKYDFLSEEYPFKKCDYIIMNPPYSVIIPFVKHSLEIAEKGILMLGRIQFLEGKERYEKILKDNPPSDIYIYVDRIYCYKNGDFSVKANSIQAYAWFYWSKKDKTKKSSIHWIRRV